MRCFDCRLLPETEAFKSCRDCGRSGLVDSRTSAGNHHTSRSRLWCSPAMYPVPGRWAMDCGELRGLPTVQFFQFVRILAQYWHQLQLVVSTRIPKLLPNRKPCQGPSVTLPGQSGRLRESSTPLPPSSRFEGSGHAACIFAALFAGLQNAYRYSWRSLDLLS